MSFIDYLIFGLYMASVLAIGFYHFRRNRNAEDYYVGSRRIPASHVGLSIVATDVGAGIVIAAYFSAIMSTADSCLMASSGNFVNDILQRYGFSNASEKTIIRLSQGVTLLIGIVAVIIAARFEMVLEAILYAYAFMVSGLFIPTLGAYFWRRSSAAGAFGGMFAGGTLTLILLILKESRPDLLPAFFTRAGLDASVYGISVSLAVFVLGSLLRPDRTNKESTINTITDRKDPCLIKSK